MYYRHRDFESQAKWVYTHDNILSLKKETKVISMVPGEIAQYMKYLLCEHEDLNSNL